MSWCVMIRSARSLPNPEMSLAPPLVIVFGLVGALAVTGYLLMKPTIVTNPGVAAYKAPAANVLDYGREDKLVAAERAATEVADQENRRLGLAPTVLAATASNDGRERPAVAAAPPKQATARIQKRPDAPGQNPPRVAQREQASPSLFGWRFGMF